MCVIDFVPSSGTQVVTYLHIRFILLKRLTKDIQELKGTLNKSYLIKYLKFFFTKTCNKNVSRSYFYTTLTIIHL